MNLAGSSRANRHHVAPSRRLRGDDARDQSQPASADSAAEAVERRDELQRALAGLAEEEREAIALRFGSDLTVPEMATVLGVPLTTVEGRVYRALRKLREALT